jgi:GNAT superfamily N-acetyltransferase
LVNYFYESNQMYKLLFITLVVISLGLFLLYRNAKGSLSKTNAAQESRQEAASWLSQVKSTTASRLTGSLSTQDKHNALVILDWQITNLLHPDFADAMKISWEVARDAYTVVEMDFLKAFPDVVGKEPYFKQFEPIFANGIENVDWKAAQDIMQSILHGHFIFDASQFNDQIKALFAQDICVFVSIKDTKTKAQLGFITFLVRPGYQHGDIKVMGFAVEKSQQNRGLGKLLIGSIFAIIPGITRIFLATRVTNENALRVYRNWGFTPDAKPILDHAFNLEHWSFLEYKTDQSNTLQKIASAMEISK